jgi:tetratricopeptide (TPR) repeat protein
VRKALETVAANADAVSRHAREDDVGRRFLGRSLQQDANRALARYDEGRTENAAFLVRQATENCVACHTKLESPGDSPRAANFVAASDLAKLPAGERARLLIATRQFDEAEKVLEQLVTDPATPPSQLLPALTDYLIVSVRVKGDYARPIPTLEKVAARPDLWRRLRDDVQQWIRSLRELEPKRGAKPELAIARQRIDRARSLVPYPADHAGLVEYVDASGILHRFLEAKPASKQEAAEAWYLLGVTESETARGFWVSQADLYLETAIRTDPKSPSAEPAYALLEEGIVLDYSGSAGVNVPHAERDRLAELRRLIEGP